MAAIFSLRSPYESRATVLVFAALTALSVLAARRLSWMAIRRLRSRGYNQSQAIIVGTGRVARKTGRALRHASWMGIKTLGLRRGQPGTLDRRPGHPRHHRRSAGADRKTQGRPRLHLPCR